MLTSARIWRLSGAVITDPAKLLAGQPDLRQQLQPVRGQRGPGSYGNYQVAPVSAFFKEACIVLFMTICKMTLIDFKKKKNDFIMLISSFVLLISSCIMLISSNVLLISSFIMLISSFVLLSYYYY